MSNPWSPIPPCAGKPLVRCVDKESTTETDAIPLYVSRYVRPHKNTGLELRYIEEAMQDFEAGSSLLVFGSGHPEVCNIYQKNLDMGKIVAMDITEESGRGCDVEFRHQDFLTEDIEIFDYIFASHTIEHFTRDQMMNIVLPKCLEHARKAVVFICPYKDVGWAGADEHRIQLSEDDELAAHATKFKRLLDRGEELVLWLPGRASAGQEGKQDGER